MNDTFLREFEFPTDFSGAAEAVWVEHFDAKAGIANVALRKDYTSNAQFRLVETIVVAVKDRGSPTKPKFARRVFIVRRMNAIVPLPEDCGKCLAYLQSSVGRFAYYVFDSRSSPLAIGSSAAETTSPAPAKAECKPAPAASASVCPCVIQGTNWHDQAAGTASQTSAATAARPDDEFPDEPQEFGA